MSKTLTNILTVYKVARIVAKVVFILCIVGSAGCLLGFLSLALLGNAQSGVLQIGDVRLVLSEMIVESMDPASSVSSCALGALVCVGEATFAFFAERYCKNVLQVGTPFTYAGAKECFRLGLISIIASVSVAVLTGIVVAILTILGMEPSEMDASTFLSLSMGLFLLFLAMIYKHGAELNEGPSQEETAAHISEE